MCCSCFLLTPPCTDDDVPFQKRLFCHIHVTKKALRPRIFPTSDSDSADPGRCRPPKFRCADFAGHAHFSR